MMTNNYPAQFWDALQHYFPLILAGAGIGLFFFGVLWFTVKNGLASANPAKWFLGGLLVRMTVSLALFYWLSNHDWRRLLACLLGFVIARIWVKRMAGRHLATPANEVDSRHAS